MNPEVKRHFGAASRELLLAMRGLLDVGIESLERKPEEQPQQEQAPPPAEEEKRE